MASLMYGITAVTLLKNEIHNYLIYGVLKGCFNERFCNLHRQ